MTSKEKQELRRSQRFNHESPIMFIDLATGYYYDGKMLNYSSHGLYFESDFQVEPKENIHISIKDSPYSAENGFHRASIIWCKALSDSKLGYHYGIGIHYDEQVRP